MTVRIRLIAIAAALIFSVFPAAAQDSEEREGGIIGTGIVGEITRLGSIYVNDQKIEFTDTMPVTGSVPAVLTAELRPGHTVAVVARLDGEIWHAERIRQVLPLVGPVELVDDGSLTILGTSVNLGVIDVDVAEGDWVAVSGLWQGGSVQATAIGLLPNWQGSAHVSGTYFRPSTTGPGRVGNTEINGVTPRHLNPGDLVRITGNPVPGGIEVERLEVGLFDARVGIIQVEGYFSEPQPDGLYTVLGSGLVAYTDQPGMIDASSRTLQCGANGRLGEFSPNSLSTEEIEKIRAKLDCF